MKTKISIAALLAAVTLVTANVQAQYFPSVGGGLAWGGEIQTIGVQARGDFQFGDYFAIAPHLTYFLPKTVGSEKWNWLSMNVDVHYLFGESRYLYFYPLAGVNVSHRSDKATSNDNKESITRFGANLGFGGAYEVARESFVFLEFKYVLLAGELSQPEISAGMYFGLFGGSW
jgi:hypothetical protein